MLLRYWVWTVVMAALSCLYTIAMTYLLHPRHPYGLNLIWGSDRWWDFLVYKARFAHFHTPRFWTIVSFPFVYPAPLAIVFGLLYKLAHPLRDFLAGCAVALIAWVLWFARNLRACGVRTRAAILFALTVSLSAWPVWFFFTTANIEGVLVVTLGVGVILVLRRHFWLGAALIGVAGSMKIYPIILLGLLLSQRRYKQFAWGLAVAGMVTIGSLAFVGPSVLQASHTIALGIDFERDAYVFSLQPNDTFFNHSLFVPVKFLISHLAQLRHPMPPPRTELEQLTHNHALLQTPYLVYLALAAIAGVVAYFVRIRHLPLLNQTIALTVCAVLLPPISLDYTLLHLLIPFAFLCLYACRQSPAISERSPVLVFACFAIIFTIGTFFTIRYRFAAPVRILALAVLLFGALRHPMAWPELDGDIEPANSGETA
jgi:hypothetical protein